MTDCPCCRVPSDEFPESDFAEARRLPSGAIELTCYELLYNAPPSETVVTMMPADARALADFILENTDA